MVTRRPVDRSQEGVALIAALLLVLLLGVTGSSIYLEHLGMQLQREKEQMVLDRGREIRAAIKAYYENTPGPIKQLPRSLGDLELDTRLLTTTRYLRGVVLDPASGKRWELISDDKGGVLGVSSRSTLVPFKRSGFLPDEDFERADSISAWRFVFTLKKASP